MRFAPGSIWLAGAAMLAALPGMAADEGGAIRGGEHAGFSRIVLQVDPRTEWSLETGDGSATIVFPGKALGFDPAAVFDRMPRSRITAVHTETGAGTSAVEISLGCDCRVSTTFVDGRYLAVDVADRVSSPAVLAAAPPPESPVARATREAGIVTSAEEILLRQIERAAKQGVVNLSAPEVPAEAAPPRTEPVALARPGPTPPDVPAEPALHDQIEATTVFDRDRPESAAEPPSPPECLPDDALDVAHWSNGSPLFAQVPPLETQLVGEFDTPDPRAIGNLARLYIRYGFGAEAAGLLGGFDAPLPERALLFDLARVVDGQPVAPDGPLSVQAPCPGRHALWLALGGVSPVWRDAQSFVAVEAAFAELPPDLRALLGPGLVLRLVDAGHSQAGQRIADLTTRPGGTPSPEMELAQAGLIAAAGDPLAAARILDPLARSNGPVAPLALARLARLALDSGLPLPASLETDLRTAALEARGGPHEAALRGLLAETLARQGKLAAAIAEALAARDDLPEEAAVLSALAIRLLAAADPAQVGEAAYAEVILARAPLIDSSAPGDPARHAIATRLLAIGLPQAALTLLASPLARDDVPARLLAADAQLRIGDPQRALATLSGLEGAEAATLRARALAGTGAFGAAASQLEAAGLSDAASSYAWPSGDWSRAAASTTDPGRAAMAGYMGARKGTIAQPAAVADPASLDPAAAFQQPLPVLDRPSLAASQRLLATGPQVHDFVAQLLAAPSSPPQTAPQR